MCKRRTERRSNQVIFCHYFAHLARIICFKTHVAVGDNAYQLPVFFHNWNAGNFIPPHQLIGIADCMVWGKIKRISNDTVFASFYLVYILSLLLN
ncbi:hypothetical protein SDC9_211057 [bioreactor metagenome]|uniref:Uncharacterized protein n=1 Tax=bioreactor metagenome TaxID=1076179 RepID=A0A645JKQ2_9ZZZZ